MNEFQANSLTQNHLHSVSALEMKAKVSSTCIYIILYLFVCDCWGKVEKAKQKTAITMAQVSAQQDAQKESNFALEMSEKSVSVI